MTRFWVSALLLLISTAAHAGTVHSKTGAQATVADATVPSFQCLINQLELLHYPIKDMRGCGSGSVRHSQHPACTALDINQKRRNVTVPPMPKDEVSLARGCGLVAGATWCNKDSGHFQVGGWSGCRKASRHRMYVKAPKPRGLFDWLFNR